VRQIGVAEFKKQCHAILGRLADEGVVITKRRKPVATLVPIRTASAALIGCLRDRIKIKGDVFATGVKWDG
jgi:antitoxin (DNA-binding transcriptional repressor) of toxin-antitoxin stability system